MREFLARLWEIAGEYQTKIEANGLMIWIFGALLIFGLINCVIGYRLVRFWIMLCGFAGGAFAGYAGAHFLGYEEGSTPMIAALICGAVLALIAFLIYRAGLFLAGAVLTAAAAVYLMKPRSSAMFFACLLAGVVVGILTIRFDRPILITVTSLIGGISAGVGLAGILDKFTFPYPVLFAAGFTVLSLIIQFAMNRPKYAEEDYPDDGYDDGDDAYAGGYDDDDYDDDEYDDGGYDDDAYDIGYEDGYDDGDYREVYTEAGDDYREYR